MRVGLNATCFNNQPSGANQRFFNIYGALIRDCPETEFFIYEPKDVAVASWFGAAPNVVARPTPVPSTGRMARARAGLGFWRRTLGGDSLDLFEAFNLPLVRAPDSPTIFTIHDLRPVLAGQPILGRAIAAAVLNHAFASAERVIAVSDAIKRDILDFRPGTAVTTIYNGVDRRRFDGIGARAAEARLHDIALPERFMIAVGHLETRKNLLLLVDAVAALRDQGKIRPLILVGNDSGERERIEARIAERHVKDLVRIVSHADDNTVRALYAACHLVAFPSRYEGFGIPILEAMAAGRPLALSDLPVFRELMRNEGEFFPTDDANAAAAVIERMWSDDAERQRMIAFGKRRVEDFAFETLAGQVAGVYGSIL